MIKPARILYFIESEMPTVEEQQKAMRLQANVVFRLARVVPNTMHALEACDGVTGAVPPIYAAAYPNAEDAIAKRAREFEALIARAGEKVGEKPREPGESQEAESKDPPNLEAIKRALDPKHFAKPGDDSDEDSGDSDEDEPESHAEKAPAAPTAPAKGVQSPAQPQSAHAARGKQARPSQTPAAPAHGPAEPPAPWKPNK